MTRDERNDVDEDGGGMKTQKLAVDLRSLNVRGIGSFWGDVWKSEASRFSVKGEEASQFSLQYDGLSKRMRPSKQPD